MAVFVVKRRTKSGESRFHVRYQAGRREPQYHLGAFGTLKEAKARQGWALLELAAGRFPDPSTIRPRAARTLAGAFHDFLASRVDAAESSRRQYVARSKPILALLGSRDPASITTRDVQGLILSLSETYAPKTVRSTVSTLSLTLAHEGIDPNPCHSRQLRFPRQERQTHTLPRQEHLDGLLPRLSPTMRAVVELILASGLRVGEATQLRWCDLDHAGRRLLVARSKTRAGVRWVDDLDLPPRPKGASNEGRVFPVTPEGIRNALRYAARDTGLPVYGPHDLRHLHASRLLADGWNPADIAARLGHSHAGITLSTYSHQLPPG